MSFNDLQYGWTDFRLALTNVKLHRGVALEERGRDGEWVPHEFPFIFSDEKEELAKEIADFEGATDLRYADMTRRLTADARAPERMDSEFFLGIPEDKNAISFARDKWVEVIEISINDAGEMDFGECRQRSNIQYFEPDSESGYPGGVYAWFSVPSEAFDRIAALSEKSGDSFEVKINAKCWYWRGPIEDSQYYIDTKERQRAELAEFTAYKAMAEAATSGNDIPEGNVARPLTQAEFNSELVGQLHMLQRGVDSIRGAMWLLVLGLVGLIYLTWQSVPAH